MLGSLASSGVQTLKGHYSDFPCLKHFFLCEAGTGAYAATDIVGSAALQSNAWTSTGPFSSYMNVANETVHHNKDLSAGSWNVDGSKTCIYLICGKFDGIFSFGFGDSTPNNIEVVFYQDATPNTWAALKSDGVVSQFLTNPSGITSSAVTSMCGILVEGTTTLTQFITDVNGDYQSVSQAYTTGQPVFEPPATYSIGRDVVTSASTGIVDLSAIAVFQFDVLPNDVEEAMEWMRTEWAAGRKRIWPAWKGI